MWRRNLELWYAGAAMIAVTGFYLLAMSRLGSVPAAGNLFGHSLGVAGFALMLMTETLYSLRKRSRRARWGRMSHWLRFHIFTGLVGPYLVLLHTSWKYGGLAGAVMAMTLVVVLSGIVGRYIYTSVPRTADGAELEASELEVRIAASETELARWLEARTAANRALAGRMETLSKLPDSGYRLVLGRGIRDWGQRYRWWQALRRLDPESRAQGRELQRLVSRRRALLRQAASLALARRLLAIWHTIHIPLGVVLFTAAFVHIGAALYYATLLR